ncbi:MAG: O-antigen ligase family protein [Bacteroidota bacterium]|jgi:putative inorganic carbon (HCO3(-)) transporter
MTTPFLKGLTANQVLLFVLSIFSVSCYALVVKEQHWAFSIPLVLLTIYIGIQRIDFLFFMGVLLTPFAINFQETPIGIGVSLPSEPLMFITMMLFIARQIYFRDLDKDLLKHPVTILILLHVFWMVITTITSTMFLVSFKATLARICFVTTFYLLAVQIFKQQHKIRLFIWLYAIPLIGVIAYTVLVHATAGFTEKAAHSAMVPFYNDHTAYAAVIAMFIPIMIGFLDDWTKSNTTRFVFFTVLCIFVGAIVLSYTRAAWISLVAALLCYLAIAVRIKTSVVISASIVFVSLIILNWTNIIIELERNDEQSSTEYASHVQSASNITTDASNVERINRWLSALRMFEQKPLMGWGPGTYVFQYGPFQKNSEKTIISTNLGEGGNAHSEYIGPLAEQGVPGSLLFIAIGIAVIYRASRIIIRSKDRLVRLLAKSFLMGLVTYWVHGLLNNFLDTEKASVPFWGFVAVIVALDIYHCKQSETNTEDIVDSGEPHAQKSNIVRK